MRKKDRNPRGKRVALMLAVITLALGPLVTGPEPLRAGFIGNVPLSAAFSELPLRFEANRGQADPGVMFLSRGSGYTLYLTSDGVVLSLRKPASNVHADLKEGHRIERLVLEMRLLGANPKPQVTALGKLQAESHYFIGNVPQKWRVNVPNYCRVRYQDVYPGIDLVFYGNQRRLEYDFIVAPGADPETIQLGFEGTDNLEIDAGGDLILHTPGGQVRLRKPLIYQQSSGGRREISGGYVFRDESKVEFHVDGYDTSKTLIIDPVLVYSTYLGGTTGTRATFRGSSVEFAYGIDLDSSGNCGTP